MKEGDILINEEDIKHNGFVMLKKGTEMEVVSLGEDEMEIRLNEEGSKVTKTPTKWVNENFIIKTEE